MRLGLIALLAVACWGQSRVIGGPTNATTLRVGGNTATEAGSLFEVRDPTAVGSIVQDYIPLALYATKNANVSAITAISTDYSTDTGDGLNVYQGANGNVEFDVGFGPQSTHGLDFSMDPSNGTFTIDAVNAQLSLTSATSTFTVQEGPSVFHITRHVTSNAATAAQTILHSIGVSDPTNKYFGASLFLEANYNGSEAAAFELGAEGNYDGAFSLTRVYLYDFKASRTVWFLDSNNPQIFIFGGSGSSANINTLTFGSATAFKFISSAMPTSCSGQAAGTLWNSSGVVNVCP